MARAAQASANRSPAIMLFSPGKRRILSGQRSKSARLDLFERADAGDAAVLRRARVTARGPATVVLDERLRLRAVHLEALLHRLFAVVVALDQRLAALVVPPFDLRRIEFHVIDATRGGMHAPAAHPRDDQVVGHIDLEHVVDRHRCRLHALRLRNGARKAVEQIAARAVQVLQALLDEADDDVVGHELPGVHHFLSGDAERGAGLHRGAQHVSGGDLRNAELLPDERGLRALARARRPEKNQSHPSILSTAATSSGESTPGGISRWLMTTAMR